MAYSGIRLQYLRDPIAKKWRWYYVTYLNGIQVSKKLVKNKEK